MPFYRKRKASSKKPQKRRAPARRAPLAKLVKQIVNRSSETKMASVSFNLASFNSSIIALSDYNQLLPPISTGSVQNARTGVHINPVKLLEVPPTSNKL